MAVQPPPEEVMSDGEVFAKMEEFARKYATAGPCSLRCMLRDAIAASQRIVNRPPHPEEVEAARVFFSKIASDGLPALKNGKWLSAIEEGLLIVLESDAKGEPL